MFIFWPLVRRLVQPIFSSSFLFGGINLPRLPVLVPTAAVHRLNFPPFPAENGTSPWPPRPLFLFSIMNGSPFYTHTTTTLFPPGWSPSADLTLIAPSPQLPSLWRRLDPTLPLAIFPRPFFSSYLADFGQNFEVSARSFRPPRVGFGALLPVFVQNTKEQG